ncbi:type IV pilus secretin PilQ [Candidatus Pseudothioglobus sp. Uisw_050_01]|uniref:type IV pilus secretin PilQ n=1 Tax=Candidatus Pseudothioglobus sp. Uisw_050_01 TaxID=3230997 RepID=UPI003A893C8E
MNRFSNKLLLALAVVFISSCAPLSSNTEVNKNSLLIGPESFIADKNSLLIEPESFIADMQDKVILTSETGPVLADIYKIPSNIKRNEIYKEEKSNYIDVGDASNENAVFPITINFENITIEDMAIMFSEITGRNILLGDEVDGLVSAKLVNVPWDKALDSILKIKKLTKYVDEKANIIRIHSQDVLLAQEEFDLKRLSDQQKTRDAERSAETLYTEIFKLYYTEASKVSSEITSVINGSSGGEGESSASASGIEITIDERLNYLIIKATKSELDFISKIISEVDVRTKQILIEAFIVEASEDLGKALGATFGIIAPDVNIEDLGIEIGNDANQLDLTGTFSNSGAISGNALGLILGTSTKNLSLALAASETKGITKILSNPRVFTLDGQAAEIKQIDQIPYTVVKEGVTSIELKDAGISLSVTPVIVGDGNIILTVSVEKSTVDTTVENPPIAKRTITTKLLIQDQTIVVIGGVFTQSTKESQSKTPILGDLPFIGRLFKKEDNTDVRKELLVFLAPRII